MRLITSLLLLLLTAPVAAQESEIRSANLPPEVERELLRLYSGGAVRYDGPTQIDRADVIGRDVAAMGGPLRVVGRVDGNIAMVDGDVIIEPGAVVTGDVTVVGGEVRLENRAMVDGTITTYSLASSERHPWDHDRPRGEWDWEWERDREDETDADDDPEDERRERRRRDRVDRGDARLAVRAGSSYNRVEGLPVMFGPVIRTASPNPLRLEALAIWRSDSGSDTDRMGYRVMAEQFFGDDRRFSVGASLFSVIQPLDRWQISDLEASLAAALFHDDYRDYYGRTGWGAFAAIRPLEGLEATVEYRREDHGSRAAGDPWSLFHGGDGWRHQPLVGEGDLHLLGASVELDRRDRRDDPREGWLARISLERPLRGSLTRPPMFTVMTDPLPGAEPDIPATAMSTDFTSAQLDVRRYSRVGRRSQLNARVMAGGSLTGGALPPQYQHTLGGFGTLPGFPTFHADCGARTFVGMHDQEHYFPAYGCDRFALAQLEYRGSLALDFGFGAPSHHDDRWYDGWDWNDLDFNPRWVAFLDAGRGWGTAGSIFDTDRDTGALVDVGLGFLIDDFGIYAALPLNGGVAQEPRFFVRLGRRF